MDIGSRPTAANRNFARGCATHLKERMGDRREDYGRKHAESVTARKNFGCRDRNTSDNALVDPATGRDARSRI
jgi:hypothetical protein